MKKSIKVKADVSFDLDITTTTLVGAVVILTGIVSLFTLKDAGFATTAVVTGAGLCGAAKVCNTYYDTKLNPKEDESKADEKS